MDEVSAAAVMRKPDQSSTSTKIILTSSELDKASGLASKRDPWEVSFFASDADEERGRYARYSSSFLGRALFLFKHPDQTVDGKVHGGSYKRVVLDPDAEEDFAAYSIEAMDDKDAYVSYLKRLGLKEAFRDSQSVIVPRQIHGSKLGTGKSIIVQKMRRCGTNLLDYLEAAIFDAPIQRIMDDIVNGIVPTVCETAHKMGIMHQDIKLENIMLDSKSGKWCLGDWEGCCISTGKPSPDGLKFTFSATTAIFRPSMAKEKGHLIINDIAALCTILIWVASRLGYTLSTSDKERARLWATRCFLQVYLDEKDSLRPFGSKPPLGKRCGESREEFYQRVDAWWESMCLWFDSWDRKRYETLFSEVTGLNGFSNTIAYCLSVLYRIADQRFGSEPLDAFSDFHEKLRMAYGMDCAAPPSTPKRPPFTYKKRRSDAMLFQLGKKRRLCGAEESTPVSSKRRLFSSSVTVAA